MASIIPVAAGVYVMVRRVNNGWYSVLWQPSKGLVATGVLRDTPAKAEHAGRALATQYGYEVLGVRQG